jgi:hypothetical protein
MHEYMHDYGGEPPAAWQGPENSKNPKTKKGKTAENADRHKSKSRNTNPLVTFTGIPVTLPESWVTFTGIRKHGNLDLMMPNIPCNFFSHAQPS